MKKKTRKILFTFDYELFLGARSGTVANCMIKPTNNLIALFDNYKIRHAIFFVDTTYLLRLKSENSLACKKDLEAIISQLQMLVNKGHYIFPHIHPHWSDAIYNKELNQWSLNDYSKYRFHFITESQREELFDSSIKLLSDIIAPCNLEYDINGYRAGGWCIQPFRDFKSLFLKYGIKHEFSVIKGFKNISEAQYFDFSEAPTENVYPFEEEVCLKNEKGNFRQYTISTIPINTRTYWLNKVWAKYLWKRGYRSIGDGSGLVIKSNDVLKGKSDLFGSGDREMVSVELLNSIKLWHYKGYLKQNDYMHFISHPKMLSQHNLKCFDKFLEFASKSFNLETDFRNFE